MTVLAKPAILKEREKGNILIEPFDPSLVKNSSVDVTLGEWYYKEKKPNKIKSEIVLPDENGNDVVFDEGEILNMYDEKSVTRMWGEKPFKAQELKEDLPGIKKGSRIIVLKPGENILSHTQQAIGSSCNNITTMMKARSSIGRSQITVCRDAGWGDSNYAYYWTTELTNAGNRTVILVAGERIGQIVFFDTTGCDETDAYFNAGKYQTQNTKGKTIEEIKNMWSPSEMLPKLWTSR